MIARYTIGLFLLLTVGSLQAEEATTFEGLLEESGMLYEQPDKFIATDSHYHRFPSEKQIVSADGSLEVLYQLRPLGRISIDYEDPHNSAPHPNDLFDMLFRTLVQSIAERGTYNSQAYSAERANALFNAGWAAVAVFDLRQDENTRFRHGLLLAIHRNDAADAYTLFMTNDLDTAKPMINQAMTSLRFSSNVESPGGNGSIPNPHRPPE